MLPKPRGASARGRTAAHNRCPSTPPRPQAQRRRATLRARERVLACALTRSPNWYQPPPRRMTKFSNCAASPGPRQSEGRADSGAGSDLGAPSGPLRSALGDRSRPEPGDASGCVCRGGLGARAAARGFPVEAPRRTPTMATSGSSAPIAPIIVEISGRGRPCRRASLPPVSCAPGSPRLRSKAASGGWGESAPMRSLWRPPQPPKPSRNWGWRAATQACAYRLGQAHHLGKGHYKFPPHLCKG